MKSLTGWPAFVWWFRGWFGIRKIMRVLEAATWWYCPKCGTGWSRRFFRNVTKQLDYCLSCPELNTPPEEYE